MSLRIVPETCLQSLSVHHPHHRAHFTYRSGCYQPGRQDCSGSGGKDGGEGGFTLVEVLAAIVILGMILTVVGSMLVTTLQTRQSIEERFRRNNHGTELLHVMSRDLKDAFSPGEQAGNRRFFYGTNRGARSSSRDQLDFVTSQNTWDPSANEVADYSECGYLLKPNNSSPGLYRLYRRSEPWINGSPVRGGTLTLLHERVVSMNIEYQKQNASEEEREQYKNNWVESWDDRSRSGTLPDRVRITLILEFPAGSGEGDDEPVQRTYSTTITLR